MQVYPSPMKLERQVHSAVPSAFTPHVALAEHPPLLMAQLATRKIRDMFRHRCQDDGYIERSRHRNETYIGGQRISIHVWAPFT